MDYYNKEKLEQFMEYIHGEVKQLSFSEQVFRRFQAKVRDYGYFLVNNPDNCAPNLFADLTYGGDWLNRYIENKLQRELVIMEYKNKLAAIIREGLIKFNLKERTDNYETRTLKLEIKVKFTNLVDVYERILIWRRIEEAYLNDIPLYKIEGYDEDFWIEDIHIKNDEYGKTVFANR